ncbi:hypothetical protein I6F15_00190 [Bradyrhizobium sp. BRP14]|nr:hypothetical protein [Bradyrhizobium sp. BRP14]
MNMHQQLELPLSSQSAEVTTEQLRLALLELARLHSKKARHYRKAAQDLRGGIAIEVPPWN